MEKGGNLQNNKEIATGNTSKLLDRQFQTIFKPLKYAKNEPKT